MKFLFLGTGASAGVPVAGCQCVVCRSDCEKNQRLRACGILQKGGKNFLIDVSPDIRAVSLKYGLLQIDAIFVTHAHEDHVGGMNDLRSFSFLNNKLIPLILSERTFDILRFRFDYLLDRFAIWPIQEKRGKMVVEGLSFSYFTYHQQNVQVTGFRMGKFAYVTDIKDYDLSIFEDLDGVETLVLGAIHEGESRMHFSISEAVLFAKEIKSVKRCYLTHLSHNVDYETMTRSLPKGMMLAYDGLEIDV